MGYGKSELRTGAEHRLEAARARLDAAVASPAARADGSAALADALQVNDGARAAAEAIRLGRLHPEIAEAWKGLSEAVRFYGFALLQDVGEGSDG